MPTDIKDSLIKKKKPTIDVKVKLKLAESPKIPATQNPKNEVKPNNLDFFMLDNLMNRNSKNCRP